MELKDFVEDTLLQIIDGVKSAQAKGAGCASSTDSKHLCTVHFDIALGSDNLTNIAGKAGALFGAFTVKGQTASEDKQSAQNKVQFDIPIYLPVSTEQAHNPN